MDLGTAPDRTRRIAAWCIDACIVGVPAMVIGLLVPVVPVGALLWIVYRLWAGWHGRSAGRALMRLALSGPGGTTPAWRGIRHACVAATPVLTGVAAVAAQVAALSFDPWYLWLFALPFILTFGAAAGALVALVVWTSGPRIDRWCGVAVRSTRVHDHHRAGASSGAARSA